MAITRTQSQGTWDAGSSSKTVSSSASVVSDQVTIDDAAVLVSLQLSADNAGSPASGDIATFRIQWSNGDILGDSGNDFDTEEHAQYLTTLDTYSGNEPGEDPARRTIDVVPVAKYFRLSASCPNAASRNMVLRFRVDQQVAG